VPQIPAYPLLSVLRADDVLIALDVHDTSASSQGTVKKATVATASLLQPSADTSGTTDTANIQQAVIAGQQLAPGTFYVSNLLLDTGNILAGSGYGTILQAVSGTTGYVIALTHPATSAQVSVRNLTVNCNQVCGGILLDNTGFTPVSPFVPYDPLHSLENVFVLAANGDGYHLDNNAREIRLRNCTQYFASGYGFYLGPGAAAGGAGCTDSHFTDCTSGASGNHGWYIADTAANNMLTSCKAFYAGFTESTGDWGTTECGFEVLGAFCTFTGCSAQQAALHGFDLNAASNCTITGCEADTNSAGASVTTGVGINVNGTTQCSVIGNTGTVNTYDPPGSQAYGIQTAGTLNGTSVVGNSLYGNSGSLNRTDTGGSDNTFIDPAAVQLNYPYIETPAGFLGLTSAPSTARYFGLLYGWDGSGGSGYAQLGTTTGAGLASMLQMSQYAATSAVTVASSAAIASLGSLSVPADDPVAGAVYRFKLNGVLSIASASPATTYVCDVRWGGTGGTLLTSLHSTATANSPLLAASSALSNVPVLIEGEVEFRTSATVTGWLRMTWTNSTTAATAATVSLAVISSAVTVTTSSAESLSVDWTWGTSSASNTITIGSSVFERVA
jgi:hypothetical protein